MKALILHSDDLGFSLEGNSRIFQAMEEGLLSSASIMVNMPGSRQALEKAAGVKGRFGLHLNLTEGFPLAEKSEVPDLIKSSSQFRGPLQLALLVSRSGRNLSLRRQWRREMELQFQKALDHGVLLSHVNGHHYIETFPFLREDVLDICSRYAIRNIRVACDPTPINVFLRHASRLKTVWALWIRHNAVNLKNEAITRGFRFPEISLGVGLAGRINAELLDFWLRRYVATGQGRVEIIFHIAAPEASVLMKRLPFKFSDPESESAALRYLLLRKNELR